MKTILVLLLAVLVFKDTLGLPFTQVWRISIQSVCLGIGIYWITLHAHTTLFARYRLLFLYLIALLLSMLGAHDPVFVLLQVGSLAAMFLFFTAYFESGWDRQEQQERSETLVLTASFLYFIVVILGLIGAVLWPEQAYETTSAHRRLEGLFPEPGMLANASGLLVGLSLFGLKCRWVKGPAVCAGLLCLALTMSRTNWAAVLIGTGATAWLYYTAGRRWILVGSGILASAAAAALLLNLSPDPERFEGLVRSESLSTLSGRTKLWRAAVPAFRSNPVVGHGYTTGTEAIIDVAKRGDSRYLDYLSSLKARRGTMHNGYVQALVDSGLFGLLVYLGLLLGALHHLYQRDADRLYPAFFFVVVYGIVANLGKNFIYSASVSDSVLFWAVAVFALSLPERTLNKPAGVAPRYVTGPAAAVIPGHAAMMEETLASLSSSLKGIRDLRPSFRTVKRDLIQYGLTPGKLATRFRKDKPPPAIANSVPKAGTNLLARLMYSLKPYHRKRTKTIMNQDDKDLSRALGSIRAGQFATSHLYFSHYRSELLKLLGIRNIFIIRDPRDIVISNVIYITYKDKFHRLHKFYNHYLGSDEERITASILGIPAELLDDSVSSKGIADHLREYEGWLTEPDCMVLRFEDLIGERGGGAIHKQCRAIQDVSQHLNLNVSPSETATIAETLFSSDSRTFFSGQIGSWQNKFNEEHKHQFREAAGDILIRMGYESSEDW